MEGGEIKKYGEMYYKNGGVRSVYRNVGKESENFERGRCEYGFCERNENYYDVGRSSMVGMDIVVGREKIKILDG